MRCPRKPWKLKTALWFLTWPYNLLKWRDYENRLFHLLVLVYQICPNKTKCHKLCGFNHRRYFPTVSEIKVLIVLASLRMLSWLVLVIDFCLSPKNWLQQNFCICTSISQTGFIPTASVVLAVCGVRIPEIQFTIRLVLICISFRERDNRDLGIMAYASVLSFEDWVSHEFNERMDYKMSFRPD